MLTQHHVIGTLLYQNMSTEFTFWMFYLWPLDISPTYFLITPTLESIDLHNIIQQLSFLLFFLLCCLLKCCCLLWNSDIILIQFLKSSATPISSLADVSLNKHLNSSLTFFSAWSLFTSLSPSKSHLLPTHIMGKFLDFLRSVIVFIKGPMSWNVCLLSMA